MRINCLESCYQNLFSFLCVRVKNMSNLLCCAGGGGGGVQWGFAAVGVVWCVFVITCHPLCGY